MKGAKKWKIFPEKEVFDCAKTSGAIDFVVPKLANLLQPLGVVTFMSLCFSTGKSKIYCFADLNADNVFQSFRTRKPIAPSVFS